MPELLKQIPDMREITDYWIIYPHKIQVPLHKDDLLYESKRNYSSALNLGKNQAWPSTNWLIIHHKSASLIDLPLFYANHR